MSKNALKEIRESLMMRRAELARKQPYPHLTPLFPTAWLLYLKRAMAGSITAAVTRIPKIGLLYFL